MATSKKALHEILRNKFMADVTEFLTAKGEEVLVTNSNEIAIPCVDAEGNDEFIVLTFKVPTGSRDGDPYDGYGEAESYALHLKQKAEKEAEQAAKNAAKAAKDKAAREAKAKAKAERLAKTKTE